MASFSSTTTINGIPISTAPLALKNPLLLKPCQLSSFRNRTHLSHLAPNTSIKAVANDDGTQKPPKNANEGLKYNPLDRRNMLIGLGGLYGAATTLGGLPKTALADPAVPDVSKCYPTDGEQTGLNCCPPIPFPDINQIPAFDPRNYPSPITRVRPPAYKAATNMEYLDKFKEGIRLMKNLPTSDPRNFMSQANVHCAYCDGGYHQLGYSNTDFQVHGSWLFLPFHRCYLYFFERILCKLLDDYSFAMPFWNWDHPEGMRMPSIYTDGSSPLYDPLRDSKHQPPTLVDLNYHGADENVTEEEQIYWNLYYMYMNASVPAIAPLFMGRRYKAGDPVAGQPGSLEICPHNNVHNWTGDREDEPFHRDMGAFFSAGRDPIFYAHHSNIDRIWSIWNNQLGATRPNWDESDFNDAYFIFYDENAQPVKIYVRDCFDTRTLGYDYEEVDILWKDPPVASPTVQKKEQERRERLPPSSRSPIFDLKNQPLKTVIRARVKRPEKPRNKEHEVLVEVLAVQVELKQDDVFAKFDVYINDPLIHEPNERTRATKEFAGSFTSLPHKPKKSGKKHGRDHGHTMVTNLKLPLTKVIENIGAESDDNLEVVLVPRAGKDDIVIKNVKIEFISSSG